MAWAMLLGPHPNAAKSGSQTVAEFGQFINNAGIMRNLKLNEDRDPKDVTPEIDINLSGPVRMIQQFLPHLKTRKGALIVNVSSGLAFIPFPIARFTAPRRPRFTHSPNPCVCTLNPRQ